MIVQGNALGLRWKNDGALKGRPNRGPAFWSPFQGSSQTLPVYPGRCPGLGMGRAFGPLDARMSWSCGTGLGEVADIDLAGDGGGDQSGAAFVEEVDGTLGLRNQRIKPYYFAI